MDDFLQALTALQAADLDLLVPKASSPLASPCKRSRGKPTVLTSTSADMNNAVMSEAPVIPERGKKSREKRSGGKQVASPELPVSTTTIHAPAAQPVYGEHTLPVFAPPDKASLKVDVVDASPTPQTAGSPGKLHRPEHEWPAVGTKLAGSYFGVTYRAEVVTANKRLKSGKQLKLLDGPAKGKRFDSFTKALLVATARQRKEGNLGRKQAASGWDFWKPEVGDLTDPNSVAMRK